MTEDRYHDLDKVVSAEVLSSLKGQVIPEVCPVCRGEGKDGEPGDEPGTGYTWACENCGGSGTINRQY